MNNLNLTVTSLQSKVEKLVHLHNRFKEANLKLIEEKSQLIKDIETLKLKIKESEEKNKIIRMAKSLADNKEESLEVKLKINELVREIDKCIALLNR